MPWDTILYSCIKKSGKTTINGALTLWWGFTQEAPNELLVLANDLEQTRRRRLSAVIYQGAAGSNHGSAGWSKKDAASANIQSVVLDPNTTSDCVMKFRNQIFVGRSDSAQMKDGAHIQMVREGKIIGERWAK